jgi:hypothetical protein
VYNFFRRKKENNYNFLNINLLRCVFVDLCANNVQKTRPKYPILGTLACWGQYAGALPPSLIPHRKSIYNISAIQQKSKKKRRHHKGDGAAVAALLLRWNTC